MKFLKKMFLKEEDCKLVKHALDEFKHAGWLDKPVDEMQQMIMDNILELIRLFSKQGHSGSSAPYLLRHFSNLARWEIIGPLTGNDSEWREISKGLYQNIRCSNIFKSKKDGVYNINGRVFVDKSGCSYTKKDSRTLVTFPASIDDLKPKYIHEK